MSVMAPRRSADELGQEPERPCSPPNPEQGDAVLVVAARRGDHVAFSDLLERYRPLAFALTSGLVGDPQVAADVVQEAAVTALVELTR